MEDGVMFLITSRRTGYWISYFWPLYIQIHLTITAAKGLLFAALTIPIRMPVFRTGLPWQKYHFLGTVAIGINVSHQLESCLLDLVQAKVRDLEVFFLLIS